MFNFYFHDEGLIIQWHSSIFLSIILRTLLTGSQTWILVTVRWQHHPLSHCVALCYDIYLWNALSQHDTANFVPICTLTKLEIMLNPGGAWSYELISRLQKEGSSDDRCRISCCARVLINCWESRVPMRAYSMLVQTGAGLPWRWAVSMSEWVWETDRWALRGRDHMGLQPLLCDAFHTPTGHERVSALQEQSGRETCILSATRQNLSGSSSFGAMTGTADCNWLHTVLLLSSTDEPTVHSMPEQQLTAGQRED